VNLHTSQLRRKRVERAWLERERGAAGLASDVMPDVDARQELRRAVLSTRGSISRVEAVPADGGPTASVALIDVPDPIGAELDAFVTRYEPGPNDPAATLNAYDANDVLVTTMPVTPSPREG